MAVSVREGERLGDCGPRTLNLIVCPGCTFDRGDSSARNHRDERGAYGVLEV